MNYKIRDFLLLAGLWSIFLITPYIISFWDISYKDLLVRSWYIYAGLSILTIFYLLYPEILRGFCQKICDRQIENFVGVSPENSNTEEVNKIRNDLRNEKLIRPSTKTISDDHKKNIKKDSKLRELYNSFNNEKYEKVILDSLNYMKEISIDKKKVPYAVLAEMAYSMIEEEKDYNKEDRISVLRIIINHYDAVTPEIYVNGLLNLASIYSDTDNNDAVLKLTYKAIYISKQNKLDSSLLSYAYYIQTFVFLVQKKLSQALAAAKEGLKYADETKEALFYYLEAIIYFNFYNNTEMAEQYAKLSWSKLTSADTFSGLLVQIYYFSLFFNHKYDEACEFLSIYCNSDTSSTQIRNLPYLLVKCNRIEEAEKLAEEYKKQHENQQLDSINNALAMIAMRNSDYEKAIYLFTEILPSFESGDTNYEKYFYAEILYNRGICYLKLNNFAKAKIDINKAMELNFDDVDSDVLENLFNYDIQNSAKMELKAIEDA
ncbi:MAG: tetratricopeptide repeat protein [Alphaproteobacteria bacterium]|nr:tetratricopeptide repeat protein [Alphaproteobacteria bacterium]